MSDIFISYKREDQSKARKLADALEREGWSVWWDPKLRAGDDFDRVIESALQESRCVIVLWSEKSLASDYVRAEASEAMEHKKLVPVAIENVNLPFRFKRLHTPKLLDWDGSSDSPEFRKLVDDITAVIGKPAKRTLYPDSPDVERRETRRLQEEAEREAERARVRERQRPAKQNWLHEGQRAAWHKPNKQVLYKGLAAVAVLILVVSAIIWRFSERPTQPESVPGEREASTPQTGGQPLLKPGAVELLQSARDTKKVSSTPGTVFRDRLKIGGEGPEMVVLPAGTFGMGEQRERTVSIRKPFAIGRNEATFEEYDRFAEALGKELPKDEGWGRGRRPVINVSWSDALDYARWVSAQTGKHYRLPTEAEWEYAARSGGKDENRDERFQQLGFIPGTRKTEPVGSNKPNSIGLYDMSGNVHEWVQDCWDELAASGDFCPKRVTRSSSWSRVGQVVLSRSNFIGFRLVREIE